MPQAPATGLPVWGPRAGSARKRRREAAADTGLTARAAVQKRGSWRARPMSDILNRGFRKRASCAPFDSSAGRAEDCSASLWSHP